MHNTDQIQNLTERFCQKRESDQLTDYNEAETRIDFINPFFSALGWDIENKQKLPESYREVVYEDRLKIDNAPYKHPDYSFRAKSLARKTLLVGCENFLSKLKNRQFLSPQILKPLIKFAAMVGMPNYR